jgi:hypothetical protein
MDRLISFGVVCAALAAGVIVVCVVRHYRLLRAKRVMSSLLEEYFEGKMGVEQVGWRAREIGGRFTDGTEFFAQVAAAFQRAADTRLTQAYSAADEAGLLRSLAALKNELGLPDRYQTEGWRPGRE